MGFVNILEELSPAVEPQHLVYASSSKCVRWHTLRIPFSEDDSVDHPVSLTLPKGQRIDGAHLQPLYGLLTTGAALFTVYGPMGRPDIFILFTKAIMAAIQPIKVFNHGKMKRRIHPHRRHCCRSRGPRWTACRAR